MTAYYDDGQAQFWLGDVREVLRQLPVESVHTVVSSPPYWSLRDYGIPPSIWGGDDDHIHDWEDGPRVLVGRNDTGPADIARRAAAYGTGTGPGSAVGQSECETGASCPCGAWRGALGLEPTPALFIAHLVDVMREVRRVLRPDGTAWINMGDSFAGSWGSQGRQGETGQMKPKDKCLIPHRLGIALQDDGWYVRMDIIWSKPNPMPESVTDRPTQAHELLWLLSKSERYYYNADAIREPLQESTLERGYSESYFRNDSPKMQVAPFEVRAKANWRENAYVPDGRNKRSVWSIPTAPYAEAHFATFPPALVKPCILAGCPEGGTVLDMFLGSGTTAMVAKALGRKAIGIDLNPEYLEMAKRRCAQMGLAFAGAAE